MSFFSSSNDTIYIEDGQRVYPCRCGETHRGDYAGYDYGHHNCFHRSPLSWLYKNHLICPDCGEVFRVKDEAR